MAATETFGEDHPLEAHEQVQDHDCWIYCNHEAQISVMITGIDEPDDDAFWKA